MFPVDKENVPRTPISEYTNGSFLSVILAVLAKREKFLPLSSQLLISSGIPYSQFTGL